jgi:hypothetical protein
MRKFSPLLQIAKLDKPVKATLSMPTTSPSNDLTRLSTGRELRKGLAVSSSASSPRLYAGSSKFTL